MLDAMDVTLYSLTLAYLITEFSMDTRVAGFLNSLTFVASARALAMKDGIEPTFFLQAAAFLFAAPLSLALPETLGQKLA
jgi:hypothetical protein